MKTTRRTVEGAGRRSDGACRRVIRTDAPAWYATQVGREVRLYQTGADKLLATIRPPAAWGDRWGWNLIDGGVLVERRAR